jgi:hypothetical protein
VGPTKRWLFDSVSDNKLIIIDPFSKNTKNNHRSGAFIYYYYYFFKTIYSLNKSQPLSSFENNSRYISASYFQIQNPIPSFISHSHLPQEKNKKHKLHHSPMPTTARFPVAGDQKLRPKSGRTPLQPKNSPANHVIVSSAQTKPKQNQTEIHVVDQSNKENHHQIYPTTPTKIESLDASLAEELSAIKKKLERLRSDKERTEKMLKERDMMLELKMKELEERGEIQNNLEIELDRLYRLKQLQSHSMVTTLYAHYSKISCLFYFLIP